MITEPYDFKLDEEEEEHTFNEHEFDKGGLCPLETDDTIKSYTMIKLLGIGSYSSVWRAKKNNDLYAIKISKANKDDETVGNNEIKILRRLGNHNNILQLKEVLYHKSKNGKHMCAVVDNLGCDLHVLKRLFKYSDYNSDNESEENENALVRCMPMDLSKKITYQILDGLKHMHTKGIIHTDIKLENILVEKNIEDIKNNKDINIKLCDFGTSHPTTSKCNYSVGTIDYTAPECILGLPYGKGIDIWAVGCIVFELVTGICLFDYRRYYDDASDCSSGYSSSEFDDENDKTQIEFLLLCLMKVILGGFPAKVFKKGKYYENYFDYKGRLRFKPTFLEEDEIINVLINEFKFENQDAAELNDFLLKLLCIDPSHRACCNTLLSDKWLENRSK
tara:strand:+ start:270 stop:1442 length:1173 start_codon:yes stop_codon:yes gene_type:complete